MTLLMRTAGIALFGIAAVSCGGGSSEGGDIDAIERLMERWFATYEEGDAEVLTGLFVEDCAPLLDKAAEDMELLRERVGEIKLELTRVDIRNLTESTAEAAPEGVGFFGGEIIELGSEYPEYASLVKENGEWKISTCEFLAGGF